MQQRSLNSHFKVKKNKRDDSLSDYKSIEKEKLQEPNNYLEKITKFSTDKKQTVITTSGRAKRVSVGIEDSFEEPEVVGRRVKLENGKKKKSVEKKEEISPLVAANKTRSRRKTSNADTQNKNIAETFKNLNEKTRGNRSASKNKKKEIEEDVKMKIHEEVENEKDFKNINYFDKINEILPNDKLEKPSTSKSTKDSDNLKDNDNIKNNINPSATGLSGFTKNMVEMILKQKQEKEEKMKINGNFNYLNYSQFENSNDIQITPKKISSNLGFNNNSSFLSSKINSNLNSQFNTGLKNNKSSIDNFNIQQLITPIKPSNPINLLPEPKLSLKTLQEISKIKSERQNRFKRESTQERTRSESSFSLKFKYEELIKEERELILPPQYKSILSSFIELEHTLNFLKMSNRKQRIPNFDDIKQAIETNYKHKFEFKTFAQILYVVPHFYIYKWEKLNINNQEFSLIIDIPREYKERLNNNYEEDFNFIKLQTENYDNVIDSLTNSDLEERKKVFKNLLYAIVNEHHKNFLDSIQFSRDFDPFKFKTWHHEFNLDKVPIIPIFEILEKPSIKITSIQDFIRENDIKNTLVKRALEELEAEEKNKKSLNKIKIPLENCEEFINDAASQTTTTNSTLSKFVSAQFLEKIKAKEEAVLMSKSIIEYSTQKNKHKNSIKDFQNLAEKLQTIFIMQKKMTMGLGELATKVYNSTESIKTNFTIDNLKNIILKFKELFPNWISILEHSYNGTLVKMEKIDMIELNQRLSDSDLIRQLENSI